MTTMNGKLGYLVTSAMPGHEGASIFLPLAGFYSPSLMRDGTYGYYWTRTLVYPSSSPKWAYMGYMNDENHASTNNNGRCYGFSVRPVRNQ